MKSKKLDFLMRKMVKAAPADTEMICRAVAADFKLRGITHVEAAQKLGVVPRSVSNQISGKRPFGKKSAQKYAAAFGYDEPFLLYGTGKLRRDDRVVTVGIPTVREDVVTISREEWDSIQRRLTKLERMQRHTGSRGLRGTHGRLAAKVQGKGW